MKKSLLIGFVAIALFVSACGQAAPTQPAVSPQPSATLERAPTRGAIAAPEAAPAGGSQPGEGAATLIGTPVPPPSLKGQFVFSPGDGSIWIQDASTGKTRPLVKATADVFAESPEFSADGSQVAYMASKLTATGAAQSSIHVVDSEGKQDRMVALQPDVKTTIGWPVFSPDGKWIYYTASYAVPPSGEHFEIERIGATGGKPETVVQDAQSAVFSNDGSELVFTRFNLSTFSASLWVADASGKNAKMIVPNDLFSTVTASRFSPDGKWVLFTASGPPMRALPGALLLPERCEPILLCAIAGTAYADGLPWDLWLVSIDGKRFQRLTNVGFDSPWPAWSKDGKYIAIFETTGFYVLDLSKHAISQWKTDGGHGVMDWWSPN